MLPGGVTVARLALDQLVEVRILAGQPILSSQYTPSGHPVAQTLGIERGAPAARSFDPQLASGGPEEALFAFGSSAIS